MVPMSQLPLFQNGKQTYSSSYLDKSLVLASKRGRKSLLFMFPVCFRLNKGNSNSFQYFTA